MLTLQCTSLLTIVMYLTINSDEQCTQLQADLNRLEEWEREWLMAFNPEKCEVLRISRKKTVIYFDYILHGKILSHAH